jgi:hypothetical protein
MQPFGYERPTPHLNLTDNIHSDTQAEPRKLSSLTLYIDLWQEGKPAPGQNPPVISPPVVIFRTIGVRAEIRTQNPVLSNTRLVKMVPLSHLRRPWLAFVLDSTGFWVRISARTPILRNITTGGDITGGFCPGAGPATSRYIGSVR